MKLFQVLAIGLVLASLCVGCGQTATRDPNVDNGPVVNPLAPGAMGAKKTFGHEGHMHTAPPGMQTGIPK